MIDGKTRSGTVQTAGRTDIGMVREENQDALLILTPDDPELRRSKGDVVAVADGMGGLEGGQIASRIVVETLEEIYTASDGDVSEALVDGAHEANRRVHEFALGNGSLPMGSTLTALSLIGKQASIVQVGDSRAYRYRRGELRQITRDHSLLRELMDRGQVVDDFDSFQMHRNVLTRGLGLRSEVEVDLFEVSDVTDGDLFLVSSDGLHEVVGEKLMLQSIQEHGADLEALCDDLIEKAREYGGPDNITVALALVGDQGPSGVAESSELELVLDEDPAPNPSGRVFEAPSPPTGRTTPGGFFVAVLVAFFAGLGAALLLNESSPPPELPEGSAARQLQETRVHLDALLEKLDGAVMTREAIRDDLREIRRSTGDE